MVISPYWDIIDLRESGGVYYNSFTPENGSDVLERVQAFLMRNQSIYFTAKSAVVIKWMNVCPYGYTHCTVCPSLGPSLGPLCTYIHVSIVNNYYSKLTATQSNYEIINYN